MTPSNRHRLEGLEPDNLLGFLALLGLLRTLEREDADREESRRWRARVSWDLEHPPLRPVLHLRQAATRDEVAESAANGLAKIAKAYDFEGRKDLNYTKEDAKKILSEALGEGIEFDRGRCELLAALMTDAAIKGDKKEEVIDPTPLCLLFGQGHQHFLERLSELPQQPAPPPRGRGKNARTLTAAECLSEALFQPWHREDPTISMRWDPEEAVRYAHLAGDPTDPEYKSGTQHGANRLAAAGLAILTLAPVQRSGRVKPVPIGGRLGRPGEFFFAWPIWKYPATLCSISALLRHPGLHTGKELSHLGVDHVLIAQRISVGKFMNFTRAKMEPTVSKAKLNPAREKRITLEIIVDAYTSSERALAWHTYLEDALNFPFQAACLETQPDSPLKKGEIVRVIGMAPERNCRHEMIVTIQFANRKAGVPLAQLKPLGVPSIAKQAIEDWHYWIEMEYQL